MPRQNKRTGSDAKLLEPEKKKRIIINEPKIADYEIKYPGQPVGTKHPRHKKWVLKTKDNKCKLHPADALALKGISNDNHFPTLHGLNFEIYRKLWEKEGVPTGFYGARMLVQAFASNKKRFKRNPGAFIIPGMSNKKSRSLVIRVQQRKMKKELTFQQAQYKLMTKDKAWIDPETGENLGATTKENKERRNEVAADFAEKNEERINKMLSIWNREWREFCAYTNSPLTPKRKPRIDRKRVPKKDVQMMTMDSLSEMRRLKDHEFCCIAIPGSGEIKFAKCFSIRSDGFNDAFANETVSRGIDFLVHQKADGPQKAISQLKLDIPRKLVSIGLSAAFDASTYQAILRDRGQMVLADGGVLTWHKQIPMHAPWWKLDKEKMNAFDKHITKATVVNASIEYSGYDLCRHTKHTAAAVSQNWENFEDQQALMGVDVSQQTKRVKELACQLSQELDRLLQLKKIKGFRKKDSTIFKLLGAEEIADENLRREVEKKRKKIKKAKDGARQKFNEKFAKHQFWQNR